MIESEILKNERLRSDKFMPNQELAALVRKLSDCLSPVQAGISREFSSTQSPVVLVVGVPRSGTTLATQILAGCGAFSYPSNLMSRLAFAPSVGAMIQQLIFDKRFDLGDEFAGMRHVEAYSSDIGKTSGPLGVSEFFHFWRRFFPSHDPGWMPESELALVDIEGMRKELAAIEDVFKKPFVSKGMMLQFNLEFFLERIPEIFVVHVRRDPLAVMRSVSAARRRYYRGTDAWWSVRPREYSFLRDMNFEEQVAGQVLFTERSILDGLSKVDLSRYVEIDYKSICNDPSGFVAEVARKAGLSVPWSFASSFPSLRESRADGGVVGDAALLEAYDRFSKMPQEESFK